ncbi:hypothetical protein OUZ56_001598 [Daphnia magna]|uniref:Uncharacterized protein n=1 Tax=Daphnia magna TaxID=35525 RepID=A0ABR0A3P4_9CRUS|nr:hypothetical protein OUZ56_001598 [Daphnia magna]
MTTQQQLNTTGKKNENNQNVHRCGIIVGGHCNDEREKKCTTLSFPLDLLFNSPGILFIKTLLFEHQVLMLLAHKHTNAPFM